MQALPSAPQEVINAPIIKTRTISLPDITFFAKHSHHFTPMDDPMLDGPHIHDDYEIYFHNEGNGAFLVNNAVYPLRRGDVILTRPGDIHFLILENPCMTEHFCLWLTPSCGSQLLNFTHTADFCPHIPLGEDMGKRLFTLLERISENIDSGTPPPPISATEQASAILQACSLLAASPASAADTPALLPDEMQQIIDYIDSAFADITCTGDIAAQFNMSISTLNRRFRRHLRLSPQEFLRAKRLAHAQRLLSSGADVTESCMRSGFSDCSHFISVFKKQFGMTPHEYKKTKASASKKM